MNFNETIPETIYKEDKIAKLVELFPDYKELAEEMINKDIPYAKAEHVISNLKEDKMIVFDGKLYHNNVNEADSFIYDLLTISKHRDGGHLLVPLYTQSLGVKELYDMHYLTISLMRLFPKIKISNLVCLLQVIYGDKLPELIKTLEHMLIREKKITELRESGKPNTIQTQTY